MSRRSPLVGALTAEGISFLGTRVSMIAIPWFVLSTTGSATQTGLVAAVATGTSAGLVAVAVVAVAGPGWRTVWAAVGLASAAAAAQMAKLEAYSCFADIANRPALELAERLAALAPVDDAPDACEAGAS